MAGDTVSGQKLERVLWRHGLLSPQLLVQLVAAELSSEERSVVRLAVAVRQSSGSHLLPIVLVPDLPGERLLAVDPKKLALPEEGDLLEP